MKNPSVWTIRKINGKLSECYCTINWEYNRKSARFHHSLTFGENDEMISTPVVNKDYDPRAVKPRKPLYCKRKPTEHCFENHCPHFGYCDYEEDEII